MSFIVQKNTLTNLDQDFEDLYTQVAKLFIKEHVHLKYTSTSREPLFSKLLTEEKERIIIHFHSYLKACQITIRSGINIRNTQHLVWRFLSTLGYSSDPDIFDRMSDSDLVMIYDLNNKQIFRNISFIESSGYSSESMFH